MRTFLLFLFYFIILFLDKGSQATAAAAMTHFGYFSQHLFNIVTSGIFGAVTLRCSAEKQNYLFQEMQSLNSKKFIFPTCDLTQFSCSY